MAGVALVSPRRKFVNSAGVPYASGTLTVYYAGTTDLATTYQDRALTTANTNPITLDANGECVMWVDDTYVYKELLKDSTGATVSGYPVDNIRGGSSGASGVSEITVDRFSGTGAQTAFTLSETPTDGEDGTLVYVSGVYIQKNVYSVSGTTLTFDVAPASGTNNIEVVIIGFTDYAAAATAVAASATAAATSATNAATSATAAAASATAADASADAAALSEAEAAAIVLGDFLQSGTGAVARTFTSKARDFVSVKDFGATGDGTTDDTTAVQAAEDAATTAGKVLYWPGGDYKITNTISRSNGSMWIGEHRNQGNTSGFTNGTKITFAPTSAKSLMAPTAPTALFRVGFVTDGFYISGNSTTSAGNSIYAFDVDGLNKCRFANLTITGFRTGIRCNATINNRFEFIKIVNTYIQSVLYDAAICTTDVWDQCYFGVSPIGIQTTAIGHVGVRFRDCIFETITTYGVNLFRECYGWMFSDTYAENVPSDNTATNALFRVGFDGASLASATQIMVSGGYLAGRNAGAVGSMMDVDYTSGVILGGFHAARWTNVVQTSANTQTNRVIVSGWTAVTVTNQVSDDTKVSGFWPKDVLGSGTRNQHVHNLRGEAYSSASVACTGAITTSASWSLVKTGNVVTLRIPNVTGTASAATYFAFGEVIPAKYRPSHSIGLPCGIKDNGANQATPGWAYIDYLSGEIRVYRSIGLGTNYTAAATAGLSSDASVYMHWHV